VLSQATAPIALLFLSFFPPFSPFDDSCPTTSSKTEALLLFHITDFKAVPRMPHHLSGQSFATLPEGVQAGAACTQQMLISGFHRIPAVALKGYRTGLGRKLCLQARRTS
jgi:hypothetical protein